MYKNVGEKIKSLAELSFWLGVIVSVFVGMGLLADAYYDVEYILGIVVLVGVPLILWIGHIFMYGFGELVEKTCGIYNIMQEKNCVKSQSDEKDKEMQLNDWKEKGLITEEEYQAKKAQLENDVNE